MTGANGGGAFGTATITPTTSDLMIQSMRLLADGRVSVIVLNRGPAQIKDQVISLTVRALGLSGESLTFSGNLESGDTINFRTDAFRVLVPTEVQAIVDPSASVNDSNRGNNVQTTLLSPAGSSTTPTPQPN